MTDNVRAIALSRTVATREPSQQSALPSRPCRRVSTIACRTLATVLADLREAREDLNAAYADNHEDRTTEASDRQDVLRDEFDARLNAVLRAEGLTVSDIQTAVERAIL